MKTGSHRGPEEDHLRGQAALRALATLFSPRHNPARQERTGSVRVGRAGQEAQRRTFMSLGSG